MKQHGCEIVGVLANIGEKHPLSAIGSLRAGALEGQARARSFFLDISVIGLGHLGLPLAAILAAGGHSVWGVDRDSALLDRLADRDALWSEPGLTSLLRSQTRLRLTTDLEEACFASEVAIVAVQTPSAADGAYDAANIRDVVAKVGATRRWNKRPIVVTVLSTVMPGTCDGELAQSLLEASGRSTGPGLGLCYCPAFGAIGSLLHDYRQPDFLLVGESDPQSGAIVEAAFGSIHVAPVPVLRRTLINAEFAKIALNNFVMTKISFANMIGGICSRANGADARQVLSVLGLDSRIGSKYLTAAMPYGGPCFMRDGEAMDALARRYSVAAPLAEATRAINIGLKDALVEAIKKATPPSGRIAILGLAFRSGTDVTIGSQGLDIAELLGRIGYCVSAWDPLAKPSDLQDVRIAPSLAAAVSGADTILIANDDPQCAELPKTTGRNGKRPVVFDYWRRTPDHAMDFYDVRRAG